MLGGGVAAVVVAVWLGESVLRSGGVVPSHRGVKGAFVGNGLHGEIDVIYLAVVGKGEIVKLPYLFR